MALLPLLNHSLIRVHRLPLTIISLAALLCVQAKPATVASQDFGTSPVGTSVSRAIALPAVSPGPASLFLRYSTDFSLGTCVPSATGCTATVTLDPAKPGLRQDALIVKDANGQVAQEVFLHGVGLGPLPMFSPALATLKTIITSPCATSGYGNVAAEPNGKILYFEGLPNSLCEFDPASNSFTAIPGPSSGSSPYSGANGLAVDAAGNIYYVNNGSANAGIHRLDIVTGADSLFPGTAGAGNIVVGLNGIVFYVNQNQVFAIAPNGTLSSVVAGNATRIYGGDLGDGGPAVNAQLYQPQGLALDLSGNLYIADSGNFRVRKVDSSGTISTVFNTPIVGPLLLASDAAGAIYLTTSSQILRLDSGTGQLSTIAGQDPLVFPLTNSDPFLGVGFSASAHYLTTASSITADSDGNVWTAKYNSAGRGLYQVSPSAAPLQFPFAIAGQTASQTVSLLNAGTASLSGPLAGITGQNASDFSVSSGCPAQILTGTASAAFPEIPMGRSTSSIVPSSRQPRSQLPSPLPPPEQLYRVAHLSSSPHPAASQACNFRWMASIKATPCPFLPP